MEEVPNLVAPPAEERRDAGTLEGGAEQGDGENSAEGVPDERLSVNESSSISTTSISPLWEAEDSEAPGCKIAGPQSYLPGCARECSLLNWGILSGDSNTQSL